MQPLAGRPKSLFLLRQEGSATHQRVAATARSQTSGPRYKTPLPAGSTCLDYLPSATIYFPPIIAIVVVIAIVVAVGITVTPLLWAVGRLPFSISFAAISPASALCPAGAKPVPDPILPKNFSPPCWAIRTACSHLKYRSLHLFLPLSTSLSRYLAMEGYSSYPPGGGYGNNPRSNSYQYQNQYHPPAAPPAANPQPQQAQQLYQQQQAQQAQQYVHQAYQPPQTRQLRSYNNAAAASMNTFNQLNTPPPQFQQPVLQGLPPTLQQQQQQYPASFQQPAYQPPPQLGGQDAIAVAMHGGQQLPQQVPTEPKAPVRPPPKPVPQATIKTKFPVARIKRIMQADEDVGKVAQVTPVIVSKALELFMVSLVTKAADQAKQRGGKRITAAHLKLAVNQEEQFDFLTDIISKAPDLTATEGSGKGERGAGGGAGGGGGGNGSGSEFAQAQANMNNIIEEDGAVVPKKGRRGRKKKVSSDDDDL
ncbi:hypothetical protein DRE_03735 [Drechslerella stenobrocha 248]|uniref:NCT transcriptional regulatory complex subunit A n=1 Tax=Drechslerella stenobrocha 248 TaxID=1043628 RepID=W7I479_9PEZI|nr:hypothetical protein DRE_03735 [Drechslerella stenobrocha 248]